jgi:hypothetical protein
MGRYYSGDIEGKFWFALQPSDAPSRFGGEETEPSYINYHFNEDHLEEVEEEIQNIEESLGEKKTIIDNFFKEKASYSNDELLALGITEKDLLDYADLGIGIQIRDCVLENGDCNFEAEL